MIEPFLQGDALLASIEEPAPADELRVWWLGQSGFLIRTAGRRVLLDPYLSDSLTAKYSGTDKPHVRMTRLAIEPGRLLGIDAVTSSHNHTDHLDAETLGALRAVNPAMRLVIPEANRAFVARRLGIDASEPVGLDDGSTAVFGGMEFHGIAAAHNEIERDDSGRCLCLGYVLRCGRWTLYHSGDTLLYPDLAQKVSAKGPIDVAILPINGHDPARRVAGNLDGREAAQLAREIGARWVIPCHYATFEFNTADPQEFFVPACDGIGQRFRVLRTGELFRGA